MNHHVMEAIYIPPLFSPPYVNIVHKPQKQLVSPFCMSFVASNSTRSKKALYINMLFSIDKLKPDKHSGIQHSEILFVKMDIKTSNAVRAAR